MQESLSICVTLVVVDERANRPRRDIEPCREVDMESRGANMNICQVVNYAEPPISQIR